MYTLYELKSDGFWHPVQSFLSKNDLSYFCHTHEDEIQARTSMNGNDTISIPSGYDPVSEKQTYRKVHRDWMFFDERDRVIDPRVIMGEIPNPVRFARKHHRPTAEPRPVTKGYGWRNPRFRMGLKDEPWEEENCEGFRVNSPNRTEDPWITEPSYRIPCSWKDRTKQRHQYRETASPIGAGWNKEQFRNLPSENAELSDASWCQLPVTEVTGLHLSGSANES